MSKAHKNLKLGMGRLARILGRRNKERHTIKIKQWNIVLGDTVEILPRHDGKWKHRDEGKQGVVTKVIRSRNSVIVEGRNMTHRSRSGPEGRKLLYMKESPLHVSNVMLVDPETGNRTKIVKKVIDGERLRVSRSTGAVIPKPAILSAYKDKRKPPNALTDTEPHLVLQRTYIKPDYAAIVEMKLAAKEAKNRSPSTTSTQVPTLDSEAA